MSDLQVMASEENDDGTAEFKGMQRVVDRIVDELETLHKCLIKVREYFHGKVKPSEDSNPLFKDINHPRQE